MFRDYLPSAQFSIVAVSMAIAGGLVVLADYMTSRPAPNNALLVETTKNGIAPMNWKESLAAIQGGKTLAEPLDPTTLESLRAEAKAETLTGTVARSLLLNLSEAKSQGLGSDFPTQERLVNELAQVAEVPRGEPAYGMGDLARVPETEASLRAYGNATALLFASHPHTAFADTLIVVASILEEGVQKHLEALAEIEREYTSLSAGLRATPVPETLAPLHLQIINNLARISGLYADFRTMLSDPVRGIGALRLYHSLTQETRQLLINVANVFEGSGILFASDEPGHIWSLLLVPNASL